MVKKNIKSQKKNLKGPLEGLVIADFSQLAQGPFATQILGDLGAEIIKIEPLHGEFMRSFAMNNLYLSDVSISFLSLNRNKKSIAINLKSEKGLKAIQKLLMKVDILVENFRPGVMDRLGIGYQKLTKTNPRLIYCSSSGYGSTGPYVDRPGQDMLIQAMSGMLHLNGTEGEVPSPVSIGIADFTTGLHIVYAVLAAVIAREKTGEGQQVELNLWSSLLSVMCQEWNTYLNGGGAPQRPKTTIGSPYLGAPYGVYATQDGYLALGMNPLNKVARLVGLQRYENETSSNVIENRDEIHDRLAQHFLKQKTEKWLEILLKEDIWCAPVNHFSDLDRDPQILHNGIIESFSHKKAGKVRVAGIPTKFSKTPGRIQRPPPDLGEHSEEILTQFSGLKKAEINLMKKEGVIL